MTPQTDEAEKVNWVKVAGVGVGALGIAGGLYLFLRKPPGFDPGDTVTCHFSFEYLGTGGTYVLQVYFGSTIIGGLFNHVFGCADEVLLPATGVYEHDLLCKIPLGTKAQKYDAEALIRRPDMAEFDYLIKRVTDGAITVRGG